MGDYILREIIKDNKRVITTFLESQDMLPYQIKMIKYNKELPLFNIMVKHINNINELSYDISGYVSIYECIENMSIPLKGLVNILTKIVSTLITFDSYFLNVNNIIYHTKNVYYNLESNELKFIYIPVRDNIKDYDSNRKVLLLNLLFTIKKYGYDNEYLQKAITDVRDDIGSLNTLKQSLVNIKASVESAETDIKPINREKKGIFSNKKKVVEPQKNINEKNINYNKLSPLYMMILERGSSKEVELTGDTYLIGRLAAAVDIVINNNNVGRIHGRIEKDRNNYYYTDLNSKNGSFISNEKLIPNKRYLISNGTELILANVTIKITNNRGI